MSVIIRIVICWVYKSASIKKEEKERKKKKKEKKVRLAPGWARTSNLSVNSRTR